MYSREAAQRNTTMVKTVLLLLVVLGIGRSSGHLTPRDSPPSYRNWPCPNPDAISPCICTTDADHNLDMDCSAVISNDQLENVFQAPFPYLDFRFLTITPTVPSYYLDIIRSGVFGLVTFQHVYITGTYIEKIEEAAFVNSRERLLTLDVNNNRIEDFPFGTVPQYIYLWYLNLAGNDLPVLPDLVSDSVRELHLERNLGLSVSETTFVQVRLLEMLYLQDMSLGNIPPNVFSQLNVIRTINLDNNNYAGQLEQDTLNVPLDSLEVLHLRGNAITNIHPASITGKLYRYDFDFC